MNIPEKPDNILLQIEDASRASVVLMDMTYFFDEGKLKRKIYIIIHGEGSPGGRLPGIKRRGNFVTKIQTFRSMDCGNENIIEEEEKTNMAPENLGKFKR